MDINDTFSKIIEFGHVNSKREELQQFCKTKIDLVTKYLPRRILNSDGGDLLDCLFIGLSESPKNRVKIVDIVLNEMRNHSTSLAHCSKITCRLCLELPRLPASDVVRWCNDSVQSIVGNNDVNMIWKDVLPECLNGLSTEDTIKHCGTDLTYQEYKEQCVHTLCQCQWTEKQLVQLAAMFKEMQLSKNDHRQVVNKICSYIIDLPPDTLPPLVHQLLTLCKSYHMEIVLAHLSHYFSARLYSKLEPPPQDSESTTMDIDDIVQYSAVELSRCLSTCLYHITQGVAEPELIKKLIKQWPKTQVLRSPFIVDLALAISDKGSDFRTTCLDVIRLAIEQRVLDEQRSNQSAWVRSVLPPDVDVASVLKVLTTESANHRQLTVIGLIHLAFSLLAVPKTKTVATKCWSHGKLILVRLCKSQQETTGYILNQLGDKLAGDANHRQYADCLYLLCKLTPLSVERCSQLRTILENCQPSPNDYTSAAAVLDAVHPLINYSTRTRDTLIMVCRKGLYSRDCTYRCLALSGFLSVLRHLRVSRAEPDSGDQFSAHSYLTQLTLDLHATHQGEVVTSRVRNEAMCLEVVSIVRRCLQQDATVKQLLFTKMFSCVKEKPMLYETVLEMLHDHLVKYLPEGDSDSSLLIDKCVQVNAVTATLIEPISHLVYCIAEFLQVPEEEDLEDILSSQCVDSGAHLRARLSTILAAFCQGKALAQVNLEDPGLTDMTSESKAKVLKVQQILQCYEALIAHQIMQWNPTNSNANTVYKLSKSCTQLLENTRVTSKIGKKGSKTLLNDTRETAKSQKSQKTQKEKSKGPIKLAALSKDRAGPFKSLPCLWDLKVCFRVLELLYGETVPWSSTEQRDLVRSRRDFHRFALRCVRSVLGDVTDKQQIADHVPPVARLLYKRCLCRFQDLCDFDDETTVSCIEAFKDCLNMLFSPQHSLKMDSFLPIISGNTDSTSASNVAVLLEEVHKALSQLEEDSAATAERDATSIKLAGALAQTAALLLDVPVHSCTKLSSAIIKVEQYVRKSKQECLQLMPALLRAGAREQQEAQLIDDLLLKLKSALGKIDEEDSSNNEESAEFPYIESSRGLAVAALVCAELSARVRAGEALVARARSLVAARPVADSHHTHRIQRELLDVYKCVVVLSCQVCAWTCSVCSLRGGGGALAAAVRLLTLLAALVKHIPPEIATQLRLERLLKLSGKKLSSVLDNLITYVETSQEHASASRVLRDTKLIPRLVLEAEHFTRNVILLDEKTKLNLQQYLSLGTARDFRIRAPLLQEALNNREQNNEVNDEENLNDADTEILSLGSGDEEERDSKRRRVS